MPEAWGGGKGPRVFSPEFYAVCAAGGMLSAGATHLATTPFDVLKVNMQAVKSIGFPSLFTRSLPIRIALVGPVVTMQWFFYDTIKVLTGLPTSGGLIFDFEEISTVS